MKHTHDQHLATRTALKGRNTRGKAALLDLLRSAGKPLAVKDILAHVTTDQSTVYRTLEAFVREGTVRSVQVGKGSAYEIMPHDHHHHLICTACKGITCADVGDDIHALETRIMRDAGFAVSSHTLDFYGVCKKCI